MKFKKVLIVGGTSGLGIHLSNLYFKNNYKVTTISRNLNLKLSKKINQVICDISKSDQIKIILKNFKKKKNLF